MSPQIKTTASAAPPKKKSSFVIAPRTIKSVKKTQMPIPSSVLLLAMLLLLSTIDSTRGWQATPPPAGRKVGSASTGVPSITAAFYKNSVEDEAAAGLSTREFPPIPLPTSASGRTVQRRDDREKLLGEDRNDELVLLDDDHECALVGKLPWLDQVGCEEDVPDVNDNAFHSHWNWQLSYFKQTLTNLRFNILEQDTDDLMYVVDEEKRQRVYTVSMQSDEYRDIRMTYISFPGAQFFRCLCYPRSPAIPVMGMGLMRLGGAKHMAILDYQPLPNDKPKIQALFESELRRIQGEIPSMSQPLSRRHFDDSSEERKYFSGVPLKGNWTTPAADDDLRCREEDLERAQREFVRGHVVLTQRLLAADNDKLDDNKDTVYEACADLVLKLHSDFDAFLSVREPAGKFLRASFGKDTGGRLVHDVIFPLSRNSNIYSVD